MAREKLADVIVVDLLMPRTNGFQVCRALKAEPELFAKMKVIVTTGSGYETDKLNAFEAGAHYFLTKPIKPADILELLKQPPGPPHEAPPMTQTERLRQARLSSV